MTKSREDLEKKLTALEKTALDADPKAARNQVIADTIKINFAGSDGND